MEQTYARGRGRDIVIMVFVLVVLALLVWLFLRPPEPARQAVFGDLGLAAAPSNAVAGGPYGGAPERPAGVLSSRAPDMSNIPPAVEPEYDASNQIASRPEMPPTGQGSAPTNSASNSGGAVPSSNETFPMAGSPSPSSAAPSNAAPLRPLTPLTRREVRPPAHNSRHSLTLDGDSWPPDPASQESTAKLLAEAKAARMAPSIPSQARTADLLANDSQPSPLFDPRAGTNVVFLLDNSMSMTTNGKSLFARQELARALQSMNARQLFYVLFFHSGGYEGMPSLAPQAASPENVRAMTNWLFSAGHRGQTDPSKAFERALGLAPAPDIIWLLAGGPLPDDVIDNIREANASVHARINTVALYNRDGEERMRQIADENRGEYRFVPPSNPSAP